MNSTITEIKNTLEGINNRITEAEERISELEDKMVEITAREQNKEKRMKRIKDSLRDHLDNIKRTNIRIIGVPEEEEKKKRSEKIFEEIIVKNFPNMGKEILNQVQEAQRVPYRINPKRNTPRHILIKLSKIKYKEKILKAARGGGRGGRAGGLLGPRGLGAGARVPARPSARRRPSPAPRVSIVGRGGRMCARVNGTGRRRGPLCWRGWLRRGSGASVEHRGSGAVGAMDCYPLRTFLALKPREHG